MPRCDEWNLLIVQQAMLGVAGILLDEGPQAVHDFFHGLLELGLARIACGDVGEEGIQGRVLHGNGSGEKTKGRSIHAALRPAGPAPLPTGAAGLTIKPAG